MFPCQIQLFHERLCERNIVESSQVSRRESSLATNAGTEKTGSDNNDAGETQDHIPQRTKPAEYSKSHTSSRYTLCKDRRAQFRHTFPRELDD